MSTSLHSPFRLVLGASLLAATQVGALALEGCNPSGYADVFAPNDPVMQCAGATTTWVRNYLAPGYPPGEEDRALRTEFLVVQSDRDPVTGDTAFDETGCMHLATIERDGSVVLEQGAFLATAPAMGTWQIPLVYEFLHQPELSILARTGAQSEELDPPVERSVAFGSSGTNLTLTVDGEERHFVNLLDLLATLETTTQEDAILFAQTCYVGLLVSEARVRGFGGAGMTDYINSPKSFVGLISGELRVSADLALGTIDVVVDYGDPMGEPFVDFTGVSLWGPQIANVSWAGEGTMGGRNDFVIELDPSDPSQDIVGSYDYEGVEIHDGFGSGGAGTLTLNGMAFSVPTDQALITDLRSILPLD